MADTNLYPKANAAGHASLNTMEREACEEAAVTAPKQTTPWRTLPEAAHRARVSEALMRREAKAGRLRGYKVGGRRVWRFKATDVDAWLEGTCDEPAAIDRRTVRR